MKKILILTASPERDKVVDELISEELTKRGHEVRLAPCLRGGRKAVLEYQPDVVVIAPIRNPYSADFVEELNRFGIGVVTRHTEASCDWQDWKNISDGWKAELLGRYPYNVHAEIVWGDDEAQILNRRNLPFKAVPVGALALDVYFRDDLNKRFGTREDFNKERGLDNNKKTLIIGSPWGFADSAPDLQIPEIPIFNRDVEWRTIQLNMIKKAKDVLGDEWNILMRPHPGVLMKPYEDFAKENNIPLDKDTEAGKTLYHSDALVHAGSTMALEMHVLNKPAFQFGNINQKHPKNWWLVEDTPMSQVSPIFKTDDELIAAIKDCKPESNANKDILKRLEEGRDGKMDGKATARAADVIEKAEGKFKYVWPRSPRDYDQLTAFKQLPSIVRQCSCAICGEMFYVINMMWLKKMAAGIKLTNQQKFDFQLHNSKCPHCGTTFIRPDMDANPYDYINSPGPANQQPPIPQSAPAV